MKKLIFIFLGLSVFSLVAHNLIYGLTKIEETVFFLLTFVFVAAFLITLFIALLRFYKNNKAANKIILLVTLILVLVLDFLALDDITTGYEPSLVSEYLTLIVSVPVIGILVYLLLKFEPKSS